MKFTILRKGVTTPPKAFNQAFLTVDLWNDFSFITLFYLEYYDDSGTHHDIGNVKIGFLSQTKNRATHEELPTEFYTLKDSFFSLGDSVDYYKNIMSIKHEASRTDLLSTLNDIAFNKNKKLEDYNSDVFRVSFLRSINPRTIEDQYRRILDGYPELTNFSFTFVRSEGAELSPLSISFQFKAFSKPSSNVHALIGRNGCGKTTLFNNMVMSLMDEVEGCKFYSTGFVIQQEMEKDYFSSLISISFSAFDSFLPPPDQIDPIRGLCYRYVGLKKHNAVNYNIDNLNDRFIVEDKSGSYTGALKSSQSLDKELFDALKICIRNETKKLLWVDSVGFLIKDLNLQKIGVSSLFDIESDSLLNHSVQFIRSSLSSGHFITLFILTKLTAYVEEKTLILIDEPETHLHPPLLSTLIQSINTILSARNAIAIVATHSPVVLQEIPMSCVNIMHRNGDSSKISKPEIETYGENVGTLTREVFGLEVSKSGFHRALEDSVSSGGSYEKIMDEYKNQLGFEARAILRSMIFNRDRDA